MSKSVFDAVRALGREVGSPITVVCHEHGTINDVGINFTFGDGARVTMVTDGTKYPRPGRDTIQVVGGTYLATVLLGPNDKVDIATVVYTNAVDPDAVVQAIREILP